MGCSATRSRPIIRPAVERGLAEGLRLEGPLPTDTLMVHARDGRFDAIVAMYHDQGHIALKLLGMHRAVNVTLGLPIIRTSVAHGTAFDIAWQRQAETGSMIEALRVASRLATGKEKRMPKDDRHPLNCRYLSISISEPIRTRTIFSRSNFECYRRPHYFLAASSFLACSILRMSLSADPLGGYDRS